MTTFVKFLPLDYYDFWHDVCPTKRNYITLSKRLVSISQEGRQLGKSTSRLSNSAAIAARQALM